MDIKIPAPAGFDFKRTINSHGWYDLPPFGFDQDRWTLTRVIALGEGRAVTVEIAGAKGAVVARVPGRAGKRDAQKITRDVRHMLRLDDDMSSFYSAVRRESEFRWIAQAGAGRLLRSPTVFEDLVKTICTTNCSWALTKKMTEGLVSALGLESSDGRRAFPTPEAMASAPVKFYRDVVRAGYRAPYLKELAERAASGEIDVEGWLASGLDSDSLKREMKKVKGAGDYAAENLLKLVGRYEGLALDSWVRAKFARTRNGGAVTADREIEAYYSRFGPWRGLALWCDMTRDWLEE